MDGAIARPRDQGRGSSAEPSEGILPADELRSVVECATGAPDLRRLVRVDFHGSHSNEVFELHFGDGRALVLKRARYAWARRQFETARAAAARLRSAAGIRVPRPLALEMEGDTPCQAYWRIPHPTLDQVWPRLDQGRRSGALRSWGSLLARVHAVGAEGWGELGSTDSGPRGLAAYLERDLVERLLPACHGHWVQATHALERLAEAIPDVARAAGCRRPSLAHNDVHMGNVLCRTRPGGAVECVGLLDLDDAAALPPESDAASLEVLHGPLFERHVSPRHRAEVWRGYGLPLRAHTITFFRALHLANLGFHSALVGHEEHAGLVARALQAEVSRLEHRAVDGRPREEPATDVGR